MRLVAARCPYSGTDAWRCDHVEGGGLVCESVSGCRAAHSQQCESLRPVATRQGCGQLGFSATIGVGAGAERQAVPGLEKVSVSAPNTTPAT